MSNPVGPRAAHARHRSRQRREGRLRPARLPRRAGRRADPRRADVRRRRPLPPRAGHGGRRLRRARRGLLGAHARDRAPGAGRRQAALAPGARARGGRRHRPRRPDGARGLRRHARVRPGPPAPRHRARGAARGARALVGGHAGVGRARAAARRLRGGARAPLRGLSRRPARHRAPRPRPARPGRARRAAPGAGARGARHRSSSTASTTSSRCSATRSRRSPSTRRAPVTVSLAYEPGRVAFAGRGHTFQELMALGPEHVELPARAEHYERPALHALERTLFEPPPSGRPDPGDALLLLEGGGERAELELVAAHVARLIGERGLAPEDVAVVLREPTEHAALLAQVFGELDVPFVLERTVAAGHTALGRGLVALLRCAVAGGGADDLLTWLRTPGKLERPGLADRLEQRARIEGAASASAGAGAVGGRPSGLRPARARPPRRRGRRSGRAVPAPGRRVRRAVRGAAPRPRPGARRPRGARRARGGRRCDRRWASSSASRPSIARSCRRRAELARVLHDLEVRAHEDRRPGAVAITSPRALRARRVRAVFLCGLHEDAFPRPARPEPFLGDDERRALNAASGLRLRLREDGLDAERYLLYAVASRPTELLALSWPAADDEGEPCVRSLFVDDVLDSFDPRAATRVERRALGAAGFEPALAPTANEAARHRLAAGPGAPEPAMAWLRDPRVLGVINARATWSASALESYASCPVKWFVERLLRPAVLEPDPEPMLRGELAHRVLEDTLRDLSAGGPLTPERLDEARALLRAALDERADDARISPNAERRALGPAPAGGRPAALRRARRPRALGLHAPRVRAALRRPRGRRSARPSWPAASCSCRAASIASTSAPTAARRSSTTTRARAPRRRPSGSTSRACRSGSTCSPCRSCSAWRPVGGLYQPLGRDDDGRPRGLLLDDADPGLASVDRDRLAPSEFEALLDDVLDAALAARARHPLGRARPRPDVVRVPRRMRAPDDLPLRGGVGVTPRSPPSRPTPSRAARATSCCRPTRARARRRCSSSASSPRSSTTACAPTRCSRSPSPRRPPASCARGCAGGCSSSASARRRARPRARGSRPSTASACGSCAPTPWPPGSTRPSPCSTPPTGAPPSATAFDAALADFLAAPRADALDLAAAYAVDRLRADGGRRPRGRCARAGRRGRRCRPRARPTPAPRGPRWSARARRSPPSSPRPGPARPSTPPARRSRRAARRSTRDAPIDPRATKVGRNANALKTPAADAYRAALRGRRAGVRRRSRGPGARARRRAAGPLRRRLRRGQARARRRRLRRPRAAGARPARARARHRRRLPRSLRAHHGRRVPGHEPAAARAARAGGARQRVHGRRRAAVDLRLPPRRRRGLPRAPRRAWSAAGRGRDARDELPLAPGDPAARSTTAFGALHEHWVDLRPGRDDPPAPAARGRAAGHRRGRLERRRARRAGRSGCRPPARSSRPRRGSSPSASARSCTRRASRRATSSCCCAPRPRSTSTSARSSSPGLPTLAAGGGGWWGRQQVRDLCHLLAALANPRDEEALLGAAGLAAGRAVLRRAGARWRSSRARRAHDDLGRAVHDDAPGARRPRTRGACDAFRAWFAGERERAPRLGLDELLERALRRTALRPARARACRAARGAWPTSTSSLRLAAAFEARRGRDVRGFIDLATAELEADAREPDAPVDLGGLDAVRLMTIHAAKGLEFPVVVVADLGRRGNLSPPDLLVSGERVGLRLIGIDGSKVTALDFDAIEAERAAADEAEERRVMHVAMTRAEERLILSGAARMGEHWPAPGAGAAPISWVGPALVPGVAALDPARPPVRDHGLVRTVLNSPASDVLRLEAPAPVAPGEQLALALNGGAPASAPEPAPPPIEPVAARAGAARVAELLVAARATRSARTASTSSAASACPSRSRPTTCATRRRRRARARPARARHARARAARGRRPARRRRAARRRQRGGPRAGRRRTRSSSPTPTSPTCGRWSRPSRAARCASASPRARSRAPRARLRLRPRRRRPDAHRLRRRRRPRGRRRRAGRRLQVRPRRRRRPRGDRRGRLRRPAAHLRARRAARRARPPSRSSTSSSSARPSRPSRRYEQADAERARRRAARRRGGAARRRVPGGGRAAPRAVRRPARGARACAPTRRS